MRPLWLLVLASGISPNGITLVGDAAGRRGGASPSRPGASRSAAGCSCCRGSSTRFDGRLARVPEPRDAAPGAAFDSLLDRYADGAMLIGLAFYFRDELGR